MAAQRPSARKSTVTLLRKCRRNRLVRLVMVHAFEMNLRPANGHSNAMPPTLRCNCLSQRTRPGLASGTTQVLPMLAVVLTFFVYEEAHRRAVERQRFELRSARGEHRFRPNSQRGDRD